MKLSDNESERETQKEASQTIVRDNVALASANIKLEEDISALKERMTSLEQRFSSLEELTREMFDPNIFG